MGLDVWTMTKTIKFRSGPNHRPKHKKEILSNKRATIAHGMTNIA